MEPIFVFFLILLPLVAAVLLLITWGAYAGRTSLLWFYGAGAMAGGKYWFILSPAILVLTIAAMVVMILLRVNPSTEHFIDPGNWIHTILLIVLGGGLILALVASYWLPERLKPGWVRQLEADERATRLDHGR
ncbi:hypothetical protein F7P69_04240 [Cellulosimicrobium funkei]|nr:hypothetical protein [Cellulosimicrobium funkei]